MSAQAWQEIWCGIIYLETIDNARLHQAIMYCNGITGRKLSFWEANPSTVL